MGLGGATEKLQRVANMGEELYERINELREQIVEMRETLQQTSDTVRRLEHDLEQQGALLEALAAEQGIDVDALLTEVAIEEAEPTGADGDGTGSGEGGPGGDGATDGDDATIADAETAEEAGDDATGDDATGDDG